MNRPNGYLTKSGYVGFMPDGKWMLFATQPEYEEFFKENYSEVESA